MTFFKTLFTEKLAAMRAAAPRATLRMLHESNGFSLYLDEAVAARKVSQLGTLTDHAEDILEDSVPVLFVPLEQTIKFVEEVTLTHSVAFVDVTLANRVHNARHTMYAYFPKRVSASLGDVQKRLACHDGCSRWGVEDMFILRGMYDKPESAPETKNADDDFWG